MGENRKSVGRDHTVESFSMWKAVPLKERSNRRCAKAG
jgi:hypothetical protein